MKLWLLKQGWQIKLILYASSHQLLRAILKRMLSSSWAPWENANESITGAGHESGITHTIYIDHSNSEAYNILASIFGFICNQRCMYLLK